jgi:ribosomal protein S18 acetylase RimI-like enzyme
MTMTGIQAIGTASALDSVTLRPATEADAGALLAIYASTRAHEMAVIGWTDEQKAAFLEMQCEAQRRHYVEHYGGASFLVIERDGAPIGRLYLHQGNDDVRVIDIALLPEARGQGIGGALLRDVLAAASARGRRVSIHVEVDNPARRLYERLGFTPVEVRGLYLLMECPPAALDVAGTGVPA